MSDTPIKVLIMAAGYGTRLEPLTLAVPKPMMLVANLPIMRHNLELLVKYGFKDVIANIHYYPEQIKNYFNDGTDFGVSLAYSYEQQLLGTAGGVRNMALASGVKDAFLVLSSDALTDINLVELVEFHKENKALITMALSKVADTSQFGVVVLDEENKVIRFQEKPKREEAVSNLANTGIYVCQPEILELIPEGKFFDFARDVFPRIMQKGARISGYQLHGYWSDVGTIPQYLQSNFDVLSGRLNVKMPGTRIAENIYVGRGARIARSAKIIGPVVIGSRADIGERAEIIGPTIIGDMTIIDRGAKIKKSVLWSEIFAGANLEIENSIVGSWCHFDSRTPPIKNCVIANRCRLSVAADLPDNSMIKPDTFL